VSLDWRTPSVSSTAIEQVGWKERSQRHGVLVVGARNGNFPLQVDRLAMCHYVRSCHTHVHVPKPKMQTSRSHLEGANAGTPLVSIVVSRAVAKSLALAPISRALFAVAIGFEPMKDCSNHTPLLAVEVDWYICIVCET
jgi:hypothetical protein